MIAFFDLDRTLISRNSGALWLYKEIREQTLHPFDAMRGLFGLLRYTFGFVDLEALVRLAISRLAGREEVELRSRVEEFYRQEVVGLYRPRARAVVAQHRADGDRVVLLTSASSYLSELVARELELDDVLCNRFDVDESGAFSGQPIGAVCYGKGKLIHAKAYADRHRVSLERSTFYTDSIADLPVLEAVGWPVVVHPDPRLRRIARDRKWPIEHWG